MNGGNLADGRRASWTLVFAAVVLALSVVGVMAWLLASGGVEYFSKQSSVVSYLQTGGVTGPLLCVGAQFLQVVIFVIPGEVTQLAAGYVFGVWRGFLYAAMGVLLGSAFNFYFARVAGRSILRRFVSGTTLDKVDHALNSRKGKAALFMLFLLPGAPKDAMSYGAGLSSMSVTEFVVITGLARTPALLASILMGAHASSRDYRSMILVGAAVLLAIVGCYLYERNRSV